MVGSGIGQGGRSPGQPARQLLLPLLAVSGAVGLLALLPLPPVLALVIGAVCAFSLPAYMYLQSCRLLAAQRQAHAEETVLVQDFAQQLIDAIPYPIYLRDAQSRTIIANTAYAARFGLSTAEIIGKSPLDLGYKNAGDILAEDQRVLEGARVHKEGKAERLPHDSLTPPAGLLISKRLSKDRHGRPALVGTHVDITAWRDNETDLQSALAREVAHRRRVQDFVQRLIDVIPQPVYVKDADSRYVMVNKAFCAERGREASELVGQVSWALSPDPSVAERIRNEDAEVLNGLVVLKEEQLPHMYTGKARFRLISKATCRDANDRPVIVGANFDVTPWRTAERELQAALERETERRKRTAEYVQRLIDVIPHPVYVKSAQSRYIMVNDAFAIDRGRTKESLIGEHSAFPHSDPRLGNLVVQEDLDVLAGKVILKEEHRPHPYNKKDRYRVIAKGSCNDPEGQPVIVCAIFDVTAWRQAEERWMRAKEAAEQANEAKSRFLASISHELRTPMHAILSFARLGEDRSRNVSGQEKLFGFFSRIHQSGENLLRLLNDLLDLAKLEAGAMAVEPSPINLRKICDEVVDELHPLIEARELRVVWLECHDPEAFGDAPLLAQVVRNLLSNAIKFSPDGGALTLALHETLLDGDPDDDESPKRRAVELRVADDGPGIPEAELESVFGKFIQSSSNAKDAGGTGLGLAICREIVGAHNGEIFARNRATGSGAEFVVRVPKTSGDFLLQGNLAAG